MHRPLSDWVTRLTERGFGPINDGIEKSDARALRTFDDNWERATTVVADREGVQHRVLALQKPETGSQVVELDDHGRPLIVTESGASAIRRIEQLWPVTSISLEDFEVLRAESREIRYFLLLRLSQEGDPEDGLFHLLPWDTVETAARAISDLLRGGKVPDDLDLSHWVTPAISGISGSLGQIYEGLIDERTDLVRTGSTSLCDSLRIGPLGRIPRRTSEQFVPLVEQLSGRNPFLRHVAAVVKSRIMAEPVLHFAADFAPELPKAASEGSNRAHVERFDDGSPLTVEVRVTAAGRILVSIEYAVARSAERSDTLAIYGVMFQPVIVSSEEETAHFWVPLRERDRGASGVIELRAPRSSFRVEVDQAPVGLTEVANLEDAQISASILAAGPEAWTAAVTLLPPGHPIASAVARARKG